MFRVGQKVVCVNDGTVFCHGAPSIRRGTIYTIEKTEPSWQTGTIHVWLVEVGGCGWAASRFRPVVERKTNIDVFTKMLTDERLPDLVVLQKLLERT